MRNAHVRTHVQARAPTHTHGAAAADPPEDPRQRVGSGSPAPELWPSSAQQSLFLGPVEAGGGHEGPWHFGPRTPILLQPGPGRRHMPHVSHRDTFPQRCLCLRGGLWHKSVSPAALPRGEGDHAAAPLGIQGPLRGAEADGRCQAGGNGAAERVAVLGASGRQGRLAPHRRHGHGSPAQRGRLGRRGTWCS